MTEENTTTTNPEERAGLCVMGSKMPKPCPFPASVALPHHHEGAGPHLCAFHAATEPLFEEVNELGICLELIAAYLKAVRRQPYASHLQTVLERAEADFTARVELIHKTTNDLKAAEYSLIR